MAQAPDTLSNDPLLGRTFAGQYTIERLIGRGGMGRVYLADQRTPPAKVVVKVLAPDWADDPEAVARFEREAERLSEISHSNIVELFDYGHEAGVSFIVMEFVDGEPLSEFLHRRGALSPEEAVPIMAQILKGTGYAHSRELMLRDIKPENVMLCSFKGRANFVKMLDFGLAKLVQEDANITKQNVLGTANYMAPEAIKGGQVDLRVDVYALGVLLYQMLAGKLPFAADTDTAVLYKHVNEPPPPLVDALPANASIPDGLLELIHDCLAKDVDDRPADANEIVERLIDCVPLSMFRLPRSDGSPSTGQSLTGKITGMHDPGRVVALSSSRPPISKRPQSSKAANSNSALAAPTATPEAEVAPESSKKGLLIGVAGLAAAAVVGFLVLGGGDDSAQAAAQPDSKVATPDFFDASTGFTAIEARLKKDPEGALEELEQLVGHELSPTDKARAETLRAKVELARLVASAKQLEDKGELKAALATYREVVDADAANSDARAAVHRLEAEVAKADADQPVDPNTGEVIVVSVPVANLFVDEKLVGRTPYTGRLPLGAHNLRVQADGYYLRKTDIEVKPADNAPIEFTLRRVKDGDAAPSKKKKAKAPTNTAEPSPPKADPKSDDGGDSDVFMKTKKKKKKSIFLPVGD
jgi:serine/threonine protein kinase